MPNIGPAELIILAIALVVFGPKKLPEIGKGIGNAMREFNKARNDFMDSLNSEPDREEPAHSVASSSYSSSSTTTDDAPSAIERKVEYPDPLIEDDVDALPYGSDFQTEGDSQPSYRTADPEPTPVGASTSVTRNDNA